ncbi:hypothetical protein [Brevibacillus massiliensis]|uniref:hypothetical protein n=1 Tax=Brevibacillus massiliensis TaxID=1118054 RepID=UPI0002E7B4F4|nr:hypothetical protein [Brevibacillus massiliensis]
MDKRKVIEAYRRGLITLQECGQILGTEETQLDDLIAGSHPYRPLSKDRMLVVDNG